MNNNSVLIVAPCGRLRDSLRALLIAMSEVASVQVADNSRTALRSVQEHRPTVVLIDMAGQDGTASVISRQIKAGWPYIRRVVVVQGEQQRRQAGRDVADAVLVKGFSAAKLFDTMSELLPGSSMGEGIVDLAVQSADTVEGPA